MKKDLNHYNNIQDLLKDLGYVLGDTNFTREQDNKSIPTDAIVGKSVPQFVSIWKGRGEGHLDPLLPEGYPLHGQSAGLGALPLIDPIITQRSSTVNPGFPKPEIKMTKHEYVETDTPGGNFAALRRQFDVWGNFREDNETRVLWQEEFIDDKTNIYHQYTLIHKRTRVRKTAHIAGAGD